MAASLAFESVDTAPTRARIEACTNAREPSEAVMAKWDDLKDGDLPAFNAKLRNQVLPTIALPALRLPNPLPSDQNGNGVEQEQ